MKYRISNILVGLGVGAVAGLTFHVVKQHLSNLQGCDLFTPYPVSEQRYYGGDFAFGFVCAAIGTCLSALCDQIPLSPAAAIHTIDYRSLLPQSMRQGA